MESLKTQTEHLRSWAKEAKEYVDKALLKISDAASGANLAAFREVMNNDNLQMSFSKTGQYEAAGAVWMLDPLASDTSDQPARCRHGDVV
eukprot:6784040-Pyramimonas_sp.AAC.1